MAYGPEPTSRIKDFYLEKTGPREYQLGLSPLNNFQDDFIRKWYPTLESYLNKRNLIPERVRVIIVTDGEFRRWWTLEFKDLKDARMFEFTFAGIIKQDFKYG